MFRTRERRPVPKRGFSKDYYEPYLMDRVVHTGKSDTEFYVETVVFYKPAIDKVAQLRSFDSDVGVENVLRKARRDGQNVDELIASGEFASKSNATIDGTAIPRTFEERENMQKYLDSEVGRIWQSLPAELKGHMSVEDFCNNYDKSWLDKIPVQNETNVEVK